MPDSDYGDLPHPNKITGGTSTPKTVEPEKPIQIDRLPTCTDDPCSICDEQQ